MSATIIFDNRHYVSRLEQAGFTRPQAEAQAEMLTEYSETLRARPAAPPEILRRDRA